MQSVAVVLVMNARGGQERQIRDLWLAAAAPPPPPQRGLQVNE